jgi:hypothetical protein
MRISALDAAAQWNHRIRGSSCCTFHAVVHTLGEVQQSLWSSECQSCENMFEDGVQCPSCLALFFEDDGNISCNVCGFMGSPRKRNSTSAARGRGMPLGNVMQL